MTAAAANLCVVIHDVADATLASCDRLIRAIEEVSGVPLTLLAVPRYHGTPASPALAHWLDGRHVLGDEIALHGWTHRDEGTPTGLIDHIRRTHYTRSEGEFWALDADEAALRLKAGMAWFEAHGWPLHGFVAPAWLLGAGGWQALRGTALRYTSTLRQIHLIGTDTAPPITSQSIVYSVSSAWRRLSSRAWAGMVARSLRGNPVMRIELHPHDADDAGVRLSWQHLLEAELDTREALTVADVVERRRRELAIAGSGPASASAATSASASAATQISTAPSMSLSAPAGSRLAAPLKAD